MTFSKGAENVSNMTKSFRLIGSTGGHGVGPTNLLKINNVSKL